jgi:SpoU rRNA methylase family enzyme
MLENWQKFERNPLVKHLIHTPNEAFVDPCEVGPQTDLDSLIAQLPIAADGSQAQAVSNAIAGKTFILQGPPGTGKSQTITNLLAKALDEGKRILFVAEKKDALDVVKLRMDQSGIGPFSLDLHDKASTSKAVREQLASVIDILVEPDKTGFEAALQDYELALGPLRNYREQLHEAGSLGESVYSATQKFLSINSEQEMSISGEFIANATTQQHHDLLEAAKSMTELGVSAGIASENSWSFAGLGASIENETQQQVKRIVLDAESALGIAMSESSFGKFLTACRSIDDVKLLSALSGANVPTSALEYGETRGGREQIDFTIEALNKLASDRAGFEYPVERLKDFSVESTAREFADAKSAGFLTRSFKISKVYKNLSQGLGVQSPFPSSQLELQLEALVKLEKSANKALTEINKLTGMRFDDDLNAYNAADNATILTQVLQLRNLVDLAAFATGSSTAQDLVLNAHGNVRDAAVQFADSIASLFELLAATNASQALWAGAKTFGERLVEALPKLRKDAVEFGLTPLIRWISLLNAASPFYHLGLTAAITSLLSGNVGYPQAANAFEKGFYRALFENLLVVRGLVSFDGTSINNFIRKLDDSHSRLRERLPKILGAELLSRRGFDSSMKIGAIGDLMLAIRQGRNNMPLRTLLSRHWEIITRITPCVLASPDSAVRFIDPKFEAFDIVVFDEASQIRVANAIGALGRANSAIVVGDSQQMPPTSVAQSKVGSDDVNIAEEELYLSEPESILSQCEIARVPDIMLNWHYRSEDESLIAFSNKAYYHGKLSTFPTPNIDPGQRSLQFVQVKDGQFIRSADEDRGAKVEGALRTNPAEASAIVADVIARLERKETANDSIGIVTFNIQQRDLIQRLLDASANEALQKALEEGVGGEPIFVKNLEAVQGRERDVILFSIAFSAKKSDPRNLPLNFGPITHAGGHKRLNVAITRARKEVKIFCSFSPSALIEKNPPSRGLRDLAEYLDMASGSNRNEIASLATRELKHDQHRSDVFAALSAAGLPAVEEVGLSDFKVDVALLGSGKKPKAVLGILLDGPRWQSRLTVSDRDSLPVELLKSRMGWPAIERIWLPDWIRDQQGEIARIRSAFEVALKASPKVAERKVTPSAPIFVQKSVDDGLSETMNPVDVLLESTQSWRPFGSTTIAQQEYLDYLHDPRIREVVLDIIGQLTNAEGPVSKQRIGKFVASCFGYTRVVPARVDAIYSIVGSSHERDSEGFVYPATMSVVEFDSWRKSDAGAGRVPEEISLPEIANAMRDICRVAGGVRYEQLVKETSRVFGIQKVSAKILARLEDAYKWGTANGRLAINGEYVAASQ